jgi:Phage tail sheath C-terminal domain/Phage tail sheath protein subtilisin-like domain
MAETFSLSSLVVPGTYVQVRAEGLMPGPAVSTGNIGIVGTADTGEDRTHLLSGAQDVTPAVGAYDALSAGTLNLARGLEVLYRNGAGIVYARALAAGADTDDFTAAFHELLKDDVNILVAPELSTENALAVLPPVLEAAENQGKDVMAIIGSDVDPATADDGVDAVVAQVVANDRTVLTTPGFKARDAAARADVFLDGRYSAAAVAGLMSTLAPQISLTNKVLPGVVELAHRYSYGEKQALINGNVCALESRSGVRVLRALTTEQGPFRQITTRRIVDYAKSGIRQVSAPFIGRLNNQRVRAALQGAIDGFLTSMLVDEALIAYELAVTASRDDEINGRAIVNVAMQPTFSIDFVAVTLTLS